MNQVDRSAILDEARELVHRESQTVAAVVAVIGNQEFLAVLELFLNAGGKVIASGSGTSGTVARRLAHLLSVTGTPALYLNPTDALHGSLGAVSSQDVVVAISKGGGTGELTDFANRSKTRGATIVALTCREESALKDVADHVVVIPAGDSDPAGAIAMGSTLAMGAWTDAMAMTLMKLRGYSWADVLFTHPAGSVGEQASEILESVESVK